MFLKNSETFFASQTQILRLQQMLRARANRETFASATMFPQQCFLVCGAFNDFCNTAGSTIASGQDEANPVF